MEETQHDSPLSEAGSSDVSWWPPDFLEKLKSVSLVTTKESSGNSTCSGEFSPHAASQVLWETGCFSGQIPNGFYTAIPDKKLKELFDIIPSPGDFYSLGELGHKAEIIYVDAEKDKKLSMLKQLSATLRKGQSINPASVVKKIAGLVSDFYKRPSSELSPAKSTLEGNSQFAENRGIQLVGQIRNASCRPRAVLFKVLADVAGIESKLLVGLPTDGNSELMDSYKHLSVMVVLNSVELLVDLMRFPGQLIPLSARAFFISHISAAGESDSAENDSCDSPHEPNSPLHAFQDRLGLGHGTDGCFQSWNQEGAELSQNVSGASRRSLSMRPSTSGEARLSSSHSESNIPNAVWRRNRRKVLAEQRTASSSPEHPLLQSRGRSMLGGDKQLTGEFAADGVFTSRSDGATLSDVRRMRRRSISITPEIGDDIARAVRAMNETLKQNNLLRARGDEVVGSYSTHGNKNCDKQSKDVSSYDIGSDDEKSDACLHSRNQVDSYQQSALSSSSHYDLGIESCSRSGDSNMLGPANCVSTWKKVLQSSFFNNPVLPFQEWKIDFTELTVGTRVGIGFFGEVFRGTWNGTEVAIKVFLEQDLTAENMEDFCNEISILSRLRHPNVILFLGACLRPPHLSMVTEYMEMGSLYYLIHMSAEKKRLNWRRRLRMLQDICRGLMCIHRMKIIHRDIKTANCLVNKHWTVKICDFGLSRVATDVPVRDNSCAGTPEWMAPELIRQEPFTEKCDIFSLGVIMWELCTLRRPWEGIPPVQVIHAVANEGSRLEVPEGPLGKLIKDCWSEPDERPCCQEILSRLLECEYTLC